MILKIKKLHPHAILPKYSTEGSAAFDFYFCPKVENDKNPNSKTIRPGLSKVFETGIAVEIPIYHVLLIFSRSGHGFERGLRLANCVGVIDSDYRGEILIKLHNDTPVNEAIIMPGERIAQGLILPLPTVKFEETDVLSETIRGEQGLGSTGA